MSTSSSTTTTRSIIHVLPPSPDDTPQKCPVNSTLHASCGPERYCAEWSAGHDNNSTQSFHYCFHKTLWYPSLTARDFLAILLTATCCFLAAMAGIGGGGLILPILLLCCNFTPKEASVLSNTAVFCNTLGQFVMNSRNQQQSASNNSMQWTTILATVLIMMPPVIAGGSIAITLEGMVPSTVILILAFLTLLLATTKTYHKAHKMQQAEEAQEELHDSITNMMRPLEDEEDEDEEQANDALLASGLEWGGPSTLPGQTVTPSGNRTSNSALLDTNTRIEATDEPFLGSIRFIKEEEDNKSGVLFVDETSLTASQVSLTPPQHPSHKRAQCQDEETPNTDQEQQPGLHINTTSTYEVNLVDAPSSGMSLPQKLQALIGGFWMLDATTFLLLHAGSLIPKCSFGFVVLVCFLALVAAIFVSLGRYQLLSSTQRQSSSDNPASELRPLVTTASLGYQQQQEETSRDSNNDDNGQTNSQAASDDGPALDDSQPQPAPASEEQQHRSSLWVSLWSYCIKQPSQQQRRPLTRQDSPSRSAPLISASQSSSSIDEGDDDDHNNVLQSLLAWWLPWACILIGLLSALLGIGGGELLGPILLLVLKMDPKQSSATTAIMSMMNSGTNLLHYMVADMMIAPGYAMHLGVAGLVGGSGGRLFVAQQGRPSMIAWSLCVVLGVASALVAWELVTTPLSFQSESNKGIC